MLYCNHTLLYYKIIIAEGSDTMTFLEECGSRIKARRKQLGITQTQLSTIIGYTDHSIISKVESGLIDLTQSRISQFANALGVTETYILGWQNLTTSEIAYLVDKLSDEDREKVITFIKTFCKVGD